MYSCEVKPCNILHNTTTEKRLIKGLQLWENGNYDAIIITGGICFPSKMQTIPSGLLMSYWLSFRGVSEDKIFSENSSRDTYENISKSLNLIKDKSPDITVVTHWQHSLRFLTTFCFAHKIRIKIIPMWYWIDFKTLVLEWVMLLVHLVDIKGRSKIVQLNRENRTYPR